MTAQQINDFLALTPSEKLVAVTGMHQDVFTFLGVKYDWVRGTKSVSDKTIDKLCALEECLNMIDDLITPRQLAAFFGVLRYVSSVTGRPLYDFYDLLAWSRRRRLSSDGPFSVGQSLHPAFAAPQDEDSRLDHRRQDSADSADFLPSSICHSPNAHLRCIRHWLGGRPRRRLVAANFFRPLAIRGPQLGHSGTHGCSSRHAQRFS